MSNNAPNLSHYGSMLQTYIIQAMSLLCSF